MSNVIQCKELKAKRPRSSLGLLSILLLRSPVFSFQKQVGPNRVLFQDSHEGCGPSPLKITGTSAHAHRLGTIF